MKYAEKIKHAEKAAQDLLNNGTTEQVRNELKEQGLYDYDIDNVLASARNIIGEQFKPIIRQKIIDNESLSDAPELAQLDKETVEKIAKQEISSLAVIERKKVTKLLKEGKSPEEIFSEVRLDLYPKEKIAHQILTHQEVEKHNNGGSRMINLLGGLGLMAVGGGMSFASMQGSGGGTLFYGLILVGLGMFIKGLLTVPNPYDN